MDTTPKLAKTVQIAEPHPAPEEKFQVNWPKLACQFTFGLAFGLIIIALIEGYTL